MAKPVIMSVDDDPEVLGAIERDLRSHYKNDYRIVKAASPTEALSAAVQLKQRGTIIAMFLVDQRMQEMNGTELLKIVKKIHPDSIKVLLTAYADTDAAIQSINEIDLDHYLLKPWDPPVERLYPVLDDLLSKWSTRVRLPFDGIRVVGARWSAASFTVKEFLSRNQVPYLWIDIDADPAMFELVRQITGDIHSLPIVLFPDGSYLTAPDNTLLAEKVGLHVRAQSPFYDLIVVGGGPAGLAVALYGGSEGLKVLLIEQQAPGGQAGTSSRIENYLGFPSGITGEDLAQRAVAQAKRFGVEILTASEVVALERRDPYRIIKLHDGTEISGYSVIFTTGMKVRKLDVPGVDGLQGIGVYYGAAMTEGATYRGRDVCIIGGANSAGQGALFFSRYARSVTMLIHANDLSPSMSQYLVDRIRATANISVITSCEVVEVVGEDHLRSIRIKHLAPNQIVADEALFADGEQPITDFECAAMFIFIGATTRTEMLRGTLDLDEKGFIYTGADLPRIHGKPRGWPLEREPFMFETNIPGVFAAGDARYGANRRVAAAVGEGSASIFTIHKYLNTV
ncbi:MAG: FAD-dependent oxidoreductase [Ignavibacteria bacterium]|nr:FAD-dependent oxidoreductase [Ignavibacteria bacterium]